METQDEYVPLLPLLADYLHGSFSELPEELQARLITEDFEVGMGGSGWDELTPNGRRRRLTEIDMDNDPALKSEMRAFRNLGFWRAVVSDFGSVGDWDHWASQKYLTPREIACLMFELEPKNYDHVKSSNKLWVSGLADEIDKIERSATRDAEGKKLSPAEWIEWAQGRGYAVPDKFVKAIAEHAPAAVEQAAPETGTQNTNWILKVQAEAYRHWEEMAKTSSPTKSNIKDYLAKWCDDNGVTSEYGVKLTADYIYRFALTPWTDPTGRKPKKRKKTS